MTFHATRIARLSKAWARIGPTAAAWASLAIAPAQPACHCDRTLGRTAGPAPSSPAPVVGSEAPADGSAVEVGSARVAESESLRPSTVTPSILELIDPGRPPRRRLRYVWRVDQKESLVIDMRTAAATETAGGKEPNRALPAVHIAIAIDPVGISQDGDLRYAWRVTSATVGAASEMPSQVANSMRAEIADIGTLTGTAVVTARGLTRDVTVAGEPLEKAGQMVEQVRQTLRDVAAPLPEQDVGVGARWKKQTQVDDRDERITQIETFRLAAVEGDMGTLDDSITQTAPPQALRVPGMAPDARARMESMVGSGKARVRFDLARLVAQTTYESTTNLVISGGSAGTGAGDVTMVMHLSVTIAGSRR